jgi:hypothetical protein
MMRSPLRLQLSKAEKALVVLFVATMPFVHPQIRLDGIAYYGVARSLIIDHNLRFRGDWKDPAALPSMMGRDYYNRPVIVHATKTGHIPVHSAIGPALLWAPFIAAAHAGVLLLDRLGAQISADGFSKPYVVTVAAATCLYALFGLLFSLRLARKFVDERWAFLSTVAIWLGSGLPAYLYVDPSWSHALSVFVVALFVWYWERTRGARTLSQWIVLGLVAGLMAEVYFPNAVFFLLIFFEPDEVTRGTATRARSAQPQALLGHAASALAALVALLPTLIIRTVLFGTPLALGAYGDHGWNWTAPALLQVLFSPSQGLFTTHPVLIFAAAGLLLWLKRDPSLGRGMLASFVVFTLLIATYPLWNFGPSFGNSYFISFTTPFILGLALALSTLAERWGNAAALARRAWVVAALLVVWNLGLVFQWGTGLMPDVGRVYWQEILYNEFRVVPAQALRALQARFSSRFDRGQENG